MLIRHKRQRLATLPYCNCLFLSVEILRLMEREREFKGEKGVWPHSGDPSEPPNGESAFKEGYL